MKKIYLLVAAVVLVTSAIAQQEVVSEKKAFVSLSSGPAFPIGDFSSSDINNNYAGFAKGGFNIDFTGGYHLTKNFAFASSALFSYYMVDEQSLKDQIGMPQGTNLTVDHWQYYGLVAGPMAILNVSERVVSDVSVMAGIASANSPKFTGSNNGTRLEIAEDWATTVPVKINFGFRYSMANNLYLSAGANYIYMKPKFSVSGIPAEQKITAVTVTGGIGINF
jgi:hypothetical protein